MNPNTVLTALQILMPLAEQLVKYIEGSSTKPQFLQELSNPLKSEIAIAALKSRKAAAKKKASTGKCPL